jgi:hypothetical protein
MPPGLLLPAATVNRQAPGLARLQLAVGSAATMPTLLVAPADTGHVGATCVVKWSSPVCSFTQSGCCTGITSLL